MTTLPAARRSASTTTWRCAADCLPTPGCTASSAAQRSPRPSPPSTTTCALSSNLITPCPKRASRRSSSQVSPAALLRQGVLCSVSSRLANRSPVPPQTKTSAPRRTAAVSTSVSTRSAATAASAGAALCCTRTSTTAKKVFRPDVQFFLSFFFFMGPGVFSLYSECKLLSCSILA